MAIGDIAAEAGLPLVSGTRQASDIDSIENETRDMIGFMKLRLPRAITPGPSAPNNPAIGDVWIRTGS